MSKLANVFEYESPKGKSKKQIKVTINAIENNEFVNAVLDVLLSFGKLNAACSRRLKITF